MPLNSGSIPQPGTPVWSQTTTTWSTSTINGAGSAYSAPFQPDGYGSIAVCCQTTAGSGTYTISVLGGLKSKSINYSTDWVNTGQSATVSGAGPVQIGTVFATIYPVYILELVSQSSCSGLTVSYIVTDAALA